ncbi:hypothetical protein BGZ57DRAFT_84365 [Hyaloscypha finlandica]|nr:hypothetical protein BGZ57DRAFT_84365 [Hyaloscypha finlandica]
MLPWLWPSRLTNALAARGSHPRLLGEEGGPSGRALPPPPPPPLPPSCSSAASLSSSKGVGGDWPSPDSPGPASSQRNGNPLESQTSSLRRPCLVPGNPASPPTEACPQRANGKGFGSPVPPTTSATTANTTGTCLILSRPRAFCPLINNINNINNNRAHLVDDCVHAPTAALNKAAASPETRSVQSTSDQSPTRREPSVGKDRRVPVRQPQVS